MVPERHNGLTPQRPEFEQAWHGFDRNQVRQYLDVLEARLRQSESDRDAAMAKASTMARELETARREIGTLRNRVDELMKPPERLEDLDERMQRAGSLALSRAEEVTTRAQVAAEKHWAKTTQLSTALRERYTKLAADLDEHAEAMKAEHRAAVEATKAEVRELTVEAAQRREQLDAEAERKRRAIEREFDAKMAAEKAALDKHVADQRRASKEQAERRIAEATAEAKRRVDEATEQARKLVADAKADAERRTNEAAAEVKRLTTIREQVRAHLREAEDVLVRGESALAVSTEETEAFERNGAPIDAEPGSADGAGPDAKTKPATTPVRPGPRKPARTG